MRTIRFLAFILFACNLFADENLRLPNIFGDKMVLQRDKPVALWGWAKAGAKVSAKFAGQNKFTKTNDKGIWTLQLDELKTSFTGRQLVVTSGAEKITLTDILVGEVWVCGGQSNMEWSLRASRDSDLEVASADSPHIRFIRLPHIARPTAQEDFPVTNKTSDQGNWRQAIPEQVENCTAVGYYFAQRISRRLKVPVGLIDVSWGGTMAQHWVLNETLKPFPEMQPYHEKFEAAMKAWVDGGEKEGADKRYAADLKAWEKARAEAKTKGEREPRRPNQNNYTTPAHKRQPGGMMNGMILPVSKMTIAGALFYQGENNSFGTSWKPFHRTFPAVIADWRRVFDDEDLPIGLVQIAGWSTRRSMTYDMNHHTNVIREIQHLTWARSKNTGLIVTYDTNSNGSIHPGHKRPVGERLARWALAQVYRAMPHKSNKPIEWRGPIYASHEIKEGKVYINFEGETARGLRLNKDIAEGLYIAGQDKEFKHSRARIQGTQLVVWHEEIKEPVAVRYAWSNLPHGTLLNFRELPAYPFRTDNWPLAPHQSTGLYEVNKISK
ncbi:MAG: hypothetical protein CMO72_04940 [Verrucomicrobiales bacterium]|nr:hypothetical protein [Verrucomicrobiales bacterium]